MEHCLPTMFRFSLQKSKRLRTYHNHAKTSKILDHKLTQIIRNKFADEVNPFQPDYAEQMELLGLITLHRAASNLLYLVSENIEDHQIIIDYKEYSKTNDNEGIRRNLFFKRLDEFINNYRKEGYEAPEIYDKYDAFVTQNTFRINS